MTLLQDDLHPRLSLTEATEGRYASFQRSLNSLLAIVGEIWLGNLNLLCAAKSRNGAFFVHPVLLVHRHYLGSKFIGDVAVSICI